MPNQQNPVTGRSVVIRHWLPILTYCPVNKLPDLLYVSLRYDDRELHELYGIRKRIRQLVSRKLMFMEDIAEMLAKEFPEATEVTVSLAFDRHVVIIRRL